ncbi:MAG TPA: aspartyl protease family protein, partial [Magnetospirillaceae bacterium]|nr:aspartyl protease family protein [Magnetospirillaceae bacterium]
MKWLYSLPLLLSLLSQARAEDCSLKLVSEFDLLDNQAGLPVIGVTFNGHPAKMIIDTGAYWSGIVPSAAKGLKTKSLNYISAVGAGGGEMRTAAVVTDLKIGRLSFTKADFFIFARDNAEDPELIGNIGANILKAYDLEIDTAGRKAKIWLQDHCAGKVISWPHADGFAEIPFKLNNVGHISLPVTLEGHDYRALLDTGATASFLDKKVADRDFGLTAETANAMGTTDTLDGKDLPTFYHRFGVFDIGGLQFKNSQMAFSIGQEDSSRAGWEQERMPSITLGMHQMRGLHFYVAYGERKIYATVASGPPPLDAIDRENIQQLSSAAMKSVAAKDYAAAAASYAQAMRLGPKEAWLRIDRAFVYRQSGDLPAALVDLDEAIRLDANAAEAWAGRCSVKIQTEQFDAAFPDCQQALSVDGKQEEARLDRAFLYLRRQQLDLATEDCNAVLA